MERVEQQLKGRQALLPIDDGASLKGADRVLKLLDDDGTQEVRLVQRRRGSHWFSLFQT